MLTATVDSSRFSAGLTGLIQKAGLDGKIVVTKEVGELIKTLARISPPDNLTQSRQRIAAFINFKFSRMSEAAEFGDPQNQKKEGHGAIKWLWSSRETLNGVARESDMRKATMTELKLLSRQTTRTGMIRGRRGDQRVLITQRILTKKRTVNALIRHLQNHLGRLKAGWMVAAFDGTIPLTSGNLPPYWVTKHSYGARGRYENRLNNKNGEYANPSFLIGNSARGITQKRVNFLVQRALTIRAKAMETNTKLIVSGKRRLADYIPEGSRHLFKSS